MSLLIGTDLALLLQQAESEQFERKSELDPTDPEDCLTLVTAIASMANTSGGVILIGSKGRPISPSLQQQFDSARLDDKVNAFVEPHVSGIAVSLLNDQFVVITVGKSTNPPHIFKKDGTFQDSNGRTKTPIRRGEIRVRHSSKSESATRADIERMFEEKQRRLYEKVKMVFDAPSDARITVSDTADMAVRIDPDSPNAQPIYDLLTPDPFRDTKQELTGALKAWKTSGQLLNDRQIFKSYGQRESISDPQSVEMVLRSCWERHLPGFYWASRMESASLVQLLEQSVTGETWTASIAAVRIASLLPRDVGRPIVRMGYDSTKKSIRAECRRKLESVVRARSDKHMVLASKLTGSRISFVSGAGTKEIPLERVDGAVFDEVLMTMDQYKKENRSAFKVVELICFGPQISAMVFTSEYPENEAAEESSPV